MGELPAQRAGAQLAGAAEHAGGGDPGALGVEVVALAEPGDDPAAPVGVRERELAEAGAGLAALEQRAAAARRAGRGRSPHPRRRRSRWCRRRWLRGRRWWRGRPFSADTRVLGACPRHRDPRHRPHPGRQARRRPLLAPGHRARRDRDQGGARARRGRARPGPARRDGAGPPGRRRARSPRARPRSRPASPRRSPRRRSTRSAPRASARSGMLDAAIRAGDVEVGVGGGMESMSNAPYLLPKARFGLRMGDAKALDGMVQDGLRNPFSGKQMFEEATEVGDELELTPPRPRPLGAALARARDRRDRRRPPARGDGLGDGVLEEGRHHRRGRRGAAPRRLARAPGQAAGPELEGGLAHRRQLAGRQRRRGRARARRPRTGPRPMPRRSWARSSPRRRSPTTSPTSPARRPTRASSRSTRRACSRATSTCGRSTRPSPP